MLGDFVVTVAVESDDDPTARIVVACENGIHNYTEVDLSSGGNTIVGMNRADTDTTLATIAMTDGMDWQGWGGDYASAVADQDLACLFGINTALWEASDANGGGLADDYAVITDVVEGFMAGGGTPGDVGYPDWSTFLRDVITGTADQDSVWKPMVESAGAVNDAIDVEADVQNYSDSVAVFQSVAGTVGDGLDALYGDAALYGNTTIASVCQGIREGDVDSGAIARPLLAAGDLDEFAMAYGHEEGLLLHFEILKQCAGADSCTEIAERPSAFLGFMLGFSGDYSSAFITPMESDPNVVAGMFYVAQACNGGSAGNIQTCAMGFHDTVYQDGWAAFQDADGSFDASRFEVWGDYWMDVAQGGTESTIPPPDSADDDSAVTPSPLPAITGPAALRGLFGTQPVGSVTITAGTHRILTDSGLDDIVAMWVQNTILYGDDDAFPALSTTAFTGDASLAADATKKVILIATVSSSYLDDIRESFELPVDVLIRLNQNDQAYAIATNASNDILLLGASPRGAFYAVMDFIKNLDSHDTASAVWQMQQVLNYPDIAERLVWDTLSAGACDIYSFFNYAPTLSAIVQQDFSCSGSTVYAADMRAAMDALVWNKATGLHLYEYMGLITLNPSYPNVVSSYADFVAYLDRRFVSEPPHLFDAWAVAPYTDYEGLGQFNETFKLTQDGATYPLVPTSTAYNPGTESAVNLIANPYSEFVGVAAGCASGSTDCFTWNTGGGTGVIATDSSAAVSTPSADGSALCIQQNTASLSPAAVSYIIDPSHLEAGKFYALGYYVYHSSGVTAWQLTVTSTLNDSTTAYNSDVSITQDTDAVPASADWKYHTFIFKVPDSTLYSNPAVNKTNFYTAVPARFALTRCNCTPWPPNS